MHIEGPLCARCYAWGWEHRRNKPWPQFGELVSHVNGKHRLCAQVHGARGWATDLTEHCHWWSHYT